MRFFENPLSETKITRFLDSVFVPAEADFGFEAHPVNTAAESKAATERTVSFLIIITPWFRTCYYYNTDFI